MDRLINREEQEMHHAPVSFWRKYIFSTDHKVIARQYLFTGIFWAVIGGLLSLLIRIPHGFPNADIEWLKPLLGDWILNQRLDAEFYLSVVTIHGTVMVFFVLTAGLSGTFANFLIPLQIGARDMASPFINMLSYWMFFLSSVLMFGSLFVETGPSMAGWTAYPPLSAVQVAVSGSGAGMTLWIVSLIFFVISVLLGGINYIATVINMRTSGMSFDRLPLTVWALLLTAVLGLFSFPVLVAAFLLLISDRHLDTSFFLGDIYIDGAVWGTPGSGSAILYQHLFWFLGHPEVYIVIMPALGIASEVISVNARKPIFGYLLMVLSLAVICFMSLLVWAHHMFVSGLNPFLGSLFSLTSFVVAVPSAVKVFNYLATIWRGNLRFTPAMMFALGLVSFFISGGLTGLVLANSAADIHLHDTYFVVAHFHLVMGSSAVFGFFAGVYHWFPKLFGRMLSERLGYIHFWITFAGIYLIFFPMHFIGWNGIPRRYYLFSYMENINYFPDLNTFISVIAIITFAAQFIFLFNFFYHLFWGKPAEQNPWRANTLEWTTKAGMPTHENWEGELPAVYRWPYDYSKPGAEEDYIPQNVPLSETESSNLKEEGIRITTKSLRCQGKIH